MINTYIIIDNMTNDSEKKPLWLLPAMTKSKLSPSLYLVATPIGNLRDITLRALDVLAMADVIACEDTRISGKLLQAYGLKKKLIIYNDHSPESVRDQLLDRIENGESVALISDAGMPLISDPGYKIVKAAHDRDVPVTAIPGATATLTAVQLSGLPSDSFSFIGFLPSKEKARQDMLQKWQSCDATLIAYETAPRLQKALADIAAIMPTRTVAVTRELTKLYEEVKKGSPQELVKHYAENGAPKGEIVLVLSPPAPAQYDEAAIIDLLRPLLADHPVKKAAAQLADQTGWSKKDIYNLALKVKDE